MGARRGDRVEMFHEFYGVGHIDYRSGNAFRPVPVEGQVKAFVELGVERQFPAFFKTDFIIRLIGCTRTVVFRIPVDEFGINGKITRRADV